MSWKSFACVAALTALAVPASAVPSLSWVDNGGSADLVATLTDTGSIAVEIDLSATGSAAISNISINAAVLDTANPGSNLPLSTDTGLVGDSLAFGSPVLTVAGASEDFTLLTLDYSGTGDVLANGLVAQLGVNTPGLSATLAVGGMTFQSADFNMSGGVNLIDLNILAANFDGPGGPTTGDASGDGQVTLVDLNILASQFDANSPSVAVPEPSTLGIAAIALIAGLRSRRG